MWFSILVVMNYYLSIKHKTDTSTLQPSGLWMFLKLPSSVQSTTLDTIVEFPAMHTALHFQRYWIISHFFYFRIPTISTSLIFLLWYSWYNTYDFCFILFFLSLSPLFLSHQEKNCIYLNTCMYFLLFFSRSRTKWNNGKTTKFYSMNQKL